MVSPTDEDLLARHHPTLKPEGQPRGTSRSQLIPDQSHRATGGVNAIVIGALTGISALLATNATAKLELEPANSFCSQLGSSSSLGFDIRPHFSSVPATSTWL